MELFLVPQTHDYDEAIFREYTDEIAKFMDTPSFSCLNQVAAQTDIFAKQRELNIDRLYVIKDQNDLFLGQIILANIQAEFPEIGIWVAKSHQHKGIATQAIQQLRAINLDLSNKLFSYPVKKENIASIALVKKLNPKTVKSEDDCLVFYL